MKSKDVVIGMKVIPFRKTAGSASLQMIRERTTQGFLYVVRKERKYWVLAPTLEYEWGYFFMAGDFHPHPDHILLFPQIITLEAKEVAKWLK